MCLFFFYVRLSSSLLPTYIQPTKLSLKPLSIKATKRKPQCSEECLAHAGLTVVTEIQLGSTSKVLGGMHNSATLAFLCFWRTELYSELMSALKHFRWFYFNYFLYFFETHAAQHNSVIFHYSTAQPLTCAYLNIYKTVSRTNFIIVVITWLFYLMVHD